MRDSVRFGTRFGPEGSPPSPTVHRDEWLTLPSCGAAKGSVGTSACGTTAWREIRRRGSSPNGKENLLVWAIGG